MKLFIYSTDLEKNWFDSRKYYKCSKESFENEKNKIKTTFEVKYLW